jgi:hypothetical protein
MSTSLREKIIKYLAQDIQQSVVASSCGVTPAYISQLLDLPEVRDEINLLRSARLDTAITHDSNLDKLETRALEMVEGKLPYVKTAIEAVKIAQALNSMKRKNTASDPNSDAVSAQQVTITVPRGASLLFKMNENNQVIEVEGRTMAPLPSKALSGLQERLKVDTTVMDVAISGPATSVTHREKQELKDSARAREILRDMTTYMDGVSVVL